MHHLGPISYESTPKVGISWHEYADLFPWIEGKPLDELRESVRTEGVVEPIVFLDGAVLDGRNRYIVARELGIEYPRAEYLGDDPLGFVIAKNLPRRHLSDQQRAMLAAKLAKLPRGRRETNPPIGGISTADAAKMMDVAERSVERAKVVDRDGARELVEAVETGKVSISAGADLATLPKEKQIEVIKSADPKALAQVVKEARAAKQAEKKARRTEREAHLGAKQRALAPSMAAAWQPLSPKEALFVGKAGEHLVCADLLMQGYNCSLASQGSPYDIIVEKDAKLVRVQVKSSHVARNINMQGRNERNAYSWRIRDTKHKIDRADIVACVALDIPMVAYFAHHDCPATIQLDAPDAERLKSRKRVFERTVDQWPFIEALEKAQAADSYVEFCKIFPEFPRKKFGVIYADPPWRYQPYSSETGMDRSADNHYPTIDANVLAAVGPYVPAADDCVLFLWATVPMLTEAMHVMRRWGFAYKSNLTWLKDKEGTGYWNRNQHELLLIGTKGNPPAPAMGTQDSSVIAAPTGRHSEKPEEFAELIERYFPNLPKIELNRRGPARPGWSAWGNEVETLYGGAAGGSMTDVTPALPPHDPNTGEILEEA